MWVDREPPKKTAECPAPWYETFSQWQTIAEELKCTVDEARKTDTELQQMAMKAAIVKQKARPSLELLAEQKANEKQRQRQMRQRK